MCIWNKIISEKNINLKPIYIVNCLLLLNINLFVYVPVKNDNFYCKFDTNKRFHVLNRYKRALDVVYSNEMGE